MRHYQQRLPCKLRSISTYFNGICNARSRQLLWTAAGSPVHLLLVSLIIIPKFKPLVNGFCTSWHDFFQPKPTNKNTTQLTLQWCSSYRLAACCTGSVFQNASASPSRFAGCLLSYPVGRQPAVSALPLGSKWLRFKSLTVYTYNYSNGIITGEVPLFCFSKLFFSEDEARLIMRISKDSLRTKNLEPQAISTL